MKPLKMQPFTTIMFLNKTKPINKTKKDCPCSPFLLG